jgi:hypothetical protein
MSEGMELMINLKTVNVQANRQLFLCCVPLLLIFYTHVNDDYPSHYTCYSIYCLEPKNKVSGIMYPAPLIFYFLT